MGALRWGGGRQPPRRAHWPPRRSDGSASPCAHHPGVRPGGEMGLCWARVCPLHRSPWSCHRDEPAPVPKACWAPSGEEEEEGDEDAREVMSSQGMQPSPSSSPLSAQATSKEGTVVTPPDLGPSRTLSQPHSHPQPGASGGFGAGAGRAHGARPCRTGGARDPCQQAEPLRHQSPN